MSFYIDRDAAADAQEGVDAFDAAFFARFGRYPDDSATAPTAANSRRAKIAALAAEGSGATDSERAVAASMLRNMEAGELSARMGNLDAEASSFGSYD